MLWGPHRAPILATMVTPFMSPLHRFGGHGGWRPPIAAGRVILAMSLSSVSPAVRVLWWPARGMQKFPHLGPVPVSPSTVPFPQTSELNRNLTMTMAFHLLGL